MSRVPLSHLYQDRCWMDMVNEYRSKMGMERVEFDDFELIMDALEKEWFGLVLASN